MTNPLRNGPFLSTVTEVPQMTQLIAVVEKVLKVKVPILQCKNTLLELKVLNSKFTWVKVQKYWHQNVLKVQKYKY